MSLFPSDISKQQALEIIENNLRLSIDSYAKSSEGSLYNYAKARTFSMPVSHLFLNVTFAWDFTKAGPAEDLHEIFSPFRDENKSMRFLAGAKINDKKLIKLLRKKGFFRAANTEGMILTAGNFQADFTSKKSLKIKKVNDENDLKLWLEPLAELFKLQGSVKESCLQLYKDLGYREATGWQHYVALQDDKPLASLSLFVEKNCTGFYNLAFPLALKDDDILLALFIEALKGVQRQGCKICSVYSQHRTKKSLQTLGFKEVCSQGTFLYMPVKLPERPRSGGLFSLLFKRGKKKDED